MVARASWVFVFVLGACVDTDRAAELVQDLGKFSHEQLCNAFDDLIHDPFRSAIVVQAACTAHALQTTKNAEECAAATDACMSTLPPPVEAQVDRILAQGNCDELSSASEGCAPASDLIACLGDLGDEITNVRLTVTCAAFGEPISPDWWKISPPDSCMDLARCVD